MTLIEVMVSVVLVSIAMVGLLGLLATVQKNNVASQDRNRVALLANELVTAMWLNNSNDVTTGNLATVYGAWQTKVSSPAAGGVATITTPTSVKSGNVATITIQWKSPQKNITSNTNNFTSYGGEEASNTYTTQVVLP
jgi:type IV pilus assembly protein PilV